MTLSCVGVLAKPGETRSAQFVSRARRRLAAAGVELVADCRIPDLTPEIEAVPTEQLARRADLLLVLGGDGTMLQAAHLLDQRELPVMGVNFGSLGYLTEFASDEFDAALELLLRGEVAVSRRLMLRAEIQRGAERRGCGSVLNDVVLHRLSLARMVELECWVDGDFMTRFRCDGLIVATPTGSTAHNLSAGGPIIEPELEALAITPICPHTLSNRPVVLSGGATIELRPAFNSEPVTLTLDGQTGVEVLPDQQVYVRAAAQRFQVVHPRGRSYFKVLRDKLHWGGEVQRG